MPYRLALVEDNPLLLSSLEKTVDHFAGCTRVGSFSRPEEALTHLPRCRPDVVLMDIRMNATSGIECVRRLKPLMPKTEFIMLTAFDNSDLVCGALAAGASGYLMKNVSSSQLERAVLDVLDGGVPMDGDIARKVIQAFRKTTSPDASLTGREQQVLAMLAQGLLYKEIAAELALSYTTVNSHVKKIYKKLQVNSRSEAIRNHHKLDPP